MRGPYDLALDQVDARADPYRVISEQEPILEIQQAVEAASMSSRAKKALQWRLEGVGGKEIARRIGRSTPLVWTLMPEARAAVRSHLRLLRHAC